MYAMRTLPIVRILIDQTGLGRNLAENIVKLWPLKVAGVDFTQAAKQMWASDLKKPMQTLRSGFPRSGHRLSASFRQTCCQWDAVEIRGG